MFSVVPVCGFIICLFVNMITLEPFEIPSWNVYEHKIWLEAWASSKMAAFWCTMLSRWWCNISDIQVVVDVNMQSDTVQCICYIIKVKVKERIVLREIHLRTTARHLSMGSHSVICHPTEVTAPPSSQPPQVGTRFINSVRMKGWVGLVGWLHTEMVYPSTDGHPSRY